MPLKAPVTAGLALATSLMLAGCDHLYGAFDTSASDARLIELARQDAARRRISLEGLLPEVARDPRMHTVSFWVPDCPPPHNCIGGGVEFTIDARALRVVNASMIE